MEKSKAVYLRLDTTLNPFESIENHSKKRPSTTKLDLQKMYGESLELTTQYKRLLKENEGLREEYQRVEAIKSGRQSLISVVERIVEEKSREMHGRQGNNFSWLVFKLNHKIYDLRAKIQAKDRAINELMLSKESEAIRQREAEAACLQEVIEWAREQGLGAERDDWRESEGLGEIREMVWMEQEVRQKEAEIIEAEKNYNAEEKEVRAMMQELARKKAELRSIKEREEEYQRAQEAYKQEKKRKEQRIAGNKNYLQELQTKRAEEVRRLEELKARHARMEEEETREIQGLREELERLREEHSERTRSRQETVVRETVEVGPVSCKREVKRVGYEQIRVIGESIGYLMALRGISERELGDYFNAEAKAQLSIREVTAILTSAPFSMSSQEEALLVARYAVEDSGEGLFLEDMDTCQSTSIVKSIIARLVGRVRVYSWEQGEALRESVGEAMHRFGKLVIQFFENKEGGERLKRRESTGGERLLVSKEQLVEAMELNLCSVRSEAQLQEEVDFSVFYLFGWSRNLRELDVNRLFTMQEVQVNWPA